MSDQFGGIHESCFLWENQPWDFSNSDNSGGSNENLVKKLADSSSNSPKRSKNGKGISTGEMNEEGKGGGGGGGESDHEIHIWTERERRKKMRNMFSNLHALLPQLPPKADKSTIVDEAVNYIKTLQHTLQKLQKQKLERLQGVATMNNFDTSMITQPKLAMEVTREAFLADQVSSSCDNMAMTTTNSLSFSRFATTFQTWTSSNVILNVCGDQAQISVCSTKKPGLLTRICFVLEKYKLEVVSAHVSSDYNRCMYMIQARASGVPDQFPETFPVEEIYKQAATDIMAWVSC
ncbi:transcription factor bHLH95 [Cornus florida]|uniref:transcription factor bHLH95 n=1 Tax=Cornus florida TaxID=4283 RepID=UPI0028994732|nr:transcription factor bHLH95 [Cornus florida]